VLAVEQEWCAQGGVDIAIAVTIAVDAEFAVGDIATGATIVS
jgi:hypothetical protein